MYHVLGVIAEYNPFHNGHLYHLAQSKRATNADFTVCVISGNFVQRGNTSLINKWTKTEMALLNGADLVIELPTLYAISSAENFAYGAVKILNSLGMVTHLSFGSEIGDIDILNKVASILYTEPKEYLAILSHELKKGLSYPKARENALLMYLSNIQMYSNVLSKSNNILGIEYLKSLKQLKSPITPIAIKREKVYYNDKCIVDEYASATAIRELLSHRSYEEMRRVMPNGSYGLLKENLKNGTCVMDLTRFEKEILYRLRTMSIVEIANLPDVSEGLENAIKNAANSCNSLAEWMNIIKSKRYTQTRLQRILLYALLNITKKDMLTSKKTAPYIRVLGFNENGKTLLSEIMRKNPKLPVITSVKKFMDTSTNKGQKEMLQKDIDATNIYTLAYSHNSWSNLDYTNKLITL